MTLRRRRSDDFRGNLCIKTFAQRGCECFLHASIFSGMKSENRRSPTRVETGRQMPQERIQSREFIIHGNADGLEDAANGKFLFIPVHAWKSLADRPCKSCCSGKAMSREHFGQDIRA